MATQGSKIRWAGHIAFLVDNRWTSRITELAFIWRKIWFTIGDERLGIEDLELLCSACTCISFTSSAPHWRSECSWWFYNVNPILVAFALFCGRLTDSATGKAFVTFAGWAVRVCEWKHLNYFTNSGDSSPPPSLLRMKSSSALMRAFREQIFLVAPFLLLFLLVHQRVISVFVPNYNVCFIKSS